LVYVKPRPRNRRPYYGEPNGANDGVFAALDLGTNNCRLLVARPLGEAFQVVDAFSRIVRLGERVTTTGELSIAAMDRTVEALKVCALKLKRRNVTHFRGVATEACRRARNGGAFVARVQHETGIDLDIISATEEAELALAGCAALLAADPPRGLLFDIGGGSTEIVWLEHTDGAWRVIDSVSMPCGVVPLSERFGGNKVDDQAYEAMIGAVVEMLQPFEARHSIAALVASGDVQMLGTSGTVTTLAGISLDLPRYDRNMVDGSTLGVDDAFKIARHLARLDYQGRAAIPCVGPERADLVVAGCAILEAICGMWRVEKLRVADRGLREGILLGLMQAAATATLG
jgi:exopolyphosphatase / guanosine-5'-triphosphate,3'-diphosphate pyrophosphatase